MNREYTLSHNLDRDETSITFDEGEPPIHSVIKLEEELIWRYDETTYSRAINDAGRDRHFAGAKAQVIGFARPEMEGDDQP